MNTIMFTDEELALLREIVDTQVSGLRQEIGNTDSIEFKERLKEEKATLVGLATKLGTRTEASTRP